MQEKLPPLYTTLELSVAVIAVTGNFLVILVFVMQRKLRKLTNYYIVSLAVSDFLVGLVGVPSAILTKMGLPQNDFGVCMLMLSLLVVLCTISILNLVAVSLDRYWAIIYPFCYHRLVTKKTVIGTIVGCYVLGAVVGFLPLFGWNNVSETPEGRCFFIPAMDYDFLVFIFFVTIAFPVLLMGFFYGSIYFVVKKQLRQISHLGQLSGNISQTTSQVNIYNVDSPSHHVQHTNHLHQSHDSIVHPARIHKREVKKAKNLFVIVLFFVICWVPLYLVNCIKAFCSVCDVPVWLMDCFIILSHANSAVNPFLYAYHLKDFREAIKKYICRGINARSEPQNSTNHELGIIQNTARKVVLTGNGKSLGISLNKVT